MLVLLLQSTNTVVIVGLVSCYRYSFSNRVSQFDDVDAIIQSLGV
jgi:hypothetical protein